MPTINLPVGQLELKGPQAATGVGRWFSLVGNLGLTGLALTCAITVAMPAGALAQTGYAPTVNAVTTTQAINVPAGSLQFKGPQRPPLSLPAGSLVFTGHATGIGGEMQVGQLAFQGYVPTLDITSGVSIALPAGSLSFGSFSFDVRAGDHAPELQAGSLVFKGPARAEARPQPGVGSVPFTGRVPLVQVDVPGSIVTIPSGVLEFRSDALDRLATQAIAVPAGTLTLSGQYVRIAFKALEPGSLAWQGLAPTASTSIALLPIPAGSLRYTGLTPTVDSSVAIPAGALAFTFPQMNVTNTGSIEIPAGSLVLTGQPATSHLVWTLPVGTLTLTGQALVPGHGSHPAQGQLVMTGYALQLVAGDRFVPIPAGSLVYRSTALEVVRVEPVVGELFGRGSFRKRLRGKGSASTDLVGRGSL